LVTPKRLSKFLSREKGQVTPALVRKPQFLFTLVLDLAAPRLVHWIGHGSGFGESLLYFAISTEILPTDLCTNAEHEAKMAFHPQAISKIERHSFQWR
jgi:hypothetical protein